MHAVRELFALVLARSPLRQNQADYLPFLGHGKMLRSRLALRLGLATGREPRALHHAAAAVELVHAASLLHDDVIDGGEMRRGQPTFWVQHGVQGAILMGDLLLCEALDLAKSGGDRRTADLLIELMGDVCRAEVEQELVRRGQPTSWDVCVSMARRKTGALFAFAAQAAACDPQDGLGTALREAGYRLGTAYQLSDDILDATGDPAAAGKTLGTDDSRRKATAANALHIGLDEAVRTVERLGADSWKGLAEWPEAQQAWGDYLAEEFYPVLDAHLGAGVAEPILALPWETAAVSHPVLT